MKKITMSCTEVGCNLQVVSKGLCKKHYMRQRNQKEKETVPIKNRSWKKSIVKRRKKLVIKFGNCCNICGEKPDWSLKKFNLPFHHLIYGGNRTEFIIEIDGDRNKSTRLLKEVEEFPERFQLLCLECHKIIGISKKHPNKVISCANFITKN